MKKIIFGVVITLFLSSCAKNICVNYQKEQTNTGTIILRPTTPTAKTFVTLNNNLIVMKKNVKSVTITNVPQGEYNIHYASNNQMYKDKLDTEIKVTMDNQGKEITKLVEVPPMSNGYWVYMGLIFVAGISLALVPLL